MEDNGELFCNTCHRVFIGGDGKCCGEVEKFSLEKHGKFLIGSSNAWIDIWNKWKDDPLLKETSQKLINDGCYGASTHLSEFINKLKENYETRIS